MSGGGGADSGQAANRSGGGGWLVGAMDWLAPFADEEPPAVVIPGGVLGPAVAPVKGTAPVASGVTGWVERLADGVGERMAGDLPGYGSLWAIEGGGVALTQAGKIVLGAVAVGVAFLLLGGGKGGR